MQGRIGFLLIPFLCSRCNIIPQTRFVNPDFPISQFLHIFSTLPYIPSVSGVLCGSDCAVQQSQSSHNDHRARSHLSSIPCPCRADGCSSALDTGRDLTSSVLVVPSGFRQGKSVFHSPMPLPPGGSKPQRADRDPLPYRGRKMHLQTDVCYFPERVYPLASRIHGFLP